MNQKKFAVILSGCGFLDGSEINEAVFSLLSLSQLNTTYEIFAPDVKFKTTNYLTQSKTNEERNILHEAARIARGKVQSTSHLNSKQFAGLIFPGGMGAIENLNLPEIKNIILDFHENKKPILAICISPKLIAETLSTITITLGSGEHQSEYGEKYVKCSATEFYYDKNNNIYSTPAFMEDASLADIYTGIHKAIKAMIEMS